MFFWHGIFCQAIITKHYLMKTLKRILVVSLIAALANAAAVAQNSGRLPDGISNATRSGDAYELAEYFNDRVELVLPEKSGVFSSIFPLSLVYHLKGTGTIYDEGLLCQISGFFLSGDTPGREGKCYLCNRTL